MFYKHFIYNNFIQKNKKIINLVIKKININ